MNIIKAYLDIWRVSNLPTVWTNVLAACVLAEGAIPQSFVFLILANSCFYMAGMSLNDLCDVNHDRIHRPTRPIPSNRISERAALIVTLLLFAAGLLMLLAAPNLSGTIAGLALILTIVAYDLRHKQNPESILLMALCRALIFVETSLALTNQVSQRILLAGSIQFFYVILVSLVARHENTHSHSASFSLIPAMLAGIALLDGVVLAVLVSFHWLAAGFVGALLTWTGQRFIRGD